VLRLAETYDLDCATCHRDEDRFFAELNEIFSDPLFRQIDLPSRNCAILRIVPGVTHSLHVCTPLYEARAVRPVAAQMGTGTTLSLEPIRSSGARPDRGQPQLFPELERLRKAADN